MLRGFEKDELEWKTHHFEVFELIHKKNEETASCDPVLFSMCRLASNSPEIDSAYTFIYTGTPQSAAILWHLCLYIQTPASILLIGNSKQITSHLPLTNIMIIFALFH